MAYERVVIGDVRRAESDGDGEGDGDGDCNPTIAVGKGMCNCKEEWGGSFVVFLLRIVSSF